MNKPIVVITHNGGEAEVDAIGFKGKACEAATKAIESALGSKSGGKRKSEYYQAEASNVRRLKIG